MKKHFVLYPFLFSVYPILSVYAHNIDMVQLGYLKRPMIIAFAVTLSLFVTLQLAFKNKHKTAILIFLYTFSFLSFGHLLNAVPTIAFGTLIIPNHIILLLLWGVLLVSITLITISSRSSLKPLSVFLNSVSIILILLPLTTIIIYQQHETKINNRKETSVPIVKARENQIYPDIYYIVLDGFARSDVLHEIYDYDNSEFIVNLKNLGFYVATNSHANYAQTYQSIASSLNSGYINYLSDSVNLESEDRKPYKNLIRNNFVHKFLKDKEYKFVTLPSFWAGTNRNLPSDIDLNYTMDINEFDKVIINTTPLGILAGSKFLSNFHRRRLLYTFDALSNITEYNFPTFTYAHFLSPHPPFVFDDEGNPINPEKVFAGLDGSHYFAIYPDRNVYKKKYQNQVKFIEKKILATLKEIINKSGQPPVIIIQADHGPGSQCDWENIKNTNLKERFSILNAYFLPSNTNSDLLYNSITPVNSFRIIFNSIFQADYKLLPDQSYFATWSQPFKLFNVTDSLNTSSVD